MKKLCLIIPCFNEYSRLNKEDYTSFLSAHIDIDLYFANDGSSDKTSELLAEFQNNHSNAHLLDYKINAGKAETIRRAVKDIEVNNYEYLGFWDADLATPFSEVKRFLNTFNSNSNLVAVTGARILRLGTLIKRKPQRHYLGRVFATIVSMMLRLPIYDTQCGAKIFKSSICKGIFKDAFVTKWFFDVELLFRIKSIAPIIVENSNVYELPLEKWEDIGGSKLKSSDFIKTPFELLKIFKKYCL